MGNEKVNILCKRCVKCCKQHIWVRVIACPKYQKKEVENERAKV